MRLKSLRATPHPAGNRIDLQWINPDPLRYPGICLVRRTGTHPVSPQDGVIVAAGEDLVPTINAQGEPCYDVTDAPLQGETVYYYSWFPYHGTPPVYDVDRANRATAMATSPYGMAAQLYSLLPAIYHRYDTALAAADAAGPLRRFLDIPGSQLDQLRSFAGALLHLYDRQHVDGRLLPLLAQWIGWHTDYRLEIDAQRNEIRSAPYLYQTIGITAAIEATVKRVLGWESRAKEFVHNVCLSNTPERLNLWAHQRHGDGTWSLAQQPLSLDGAYDGRPAMVDDGDGVQWLFYHTCRHDRWDIWYKTRPDYDSPWSPSKRLTSGPTIEKNPVALVHQATLYVFWEVYDAAQRTWRIDYCTRSAGSWSPRQHFGEDNVARRSPAILCDHTGHLWVFWLEQHGTGWQLRYKRRDAEVWELQTAHTFPRDGVHDPGVHSDLFVLFQPATYAADATPRIWVFWARRVPTSTPRQTRWQLAYRVATGVDPSALTWIRSWSLGFTNHTTVDFSTTPVMTPFRTWYVNKPLDWGPVHTLPATLAAENCREPAAFFNAQNDLELFWSADTRGSWSLWRRTLLSLEPPAWSSATELTSGPYTQRAPLPVLTQTETLLLCRSNASVSYRSAVYRATETVDTRYAGCTTVDTRNLGKMALRKRFEDFQCYVYDTGQHGTRTERNWYARDTVGMYLEPDTDDPQTIVRSRNLINAVLQQFLPAQVRIVFIIPIVSQERIYTYAFPDVRPARLIDEQVLDRLDVRGAEHYPVPGETYQDIMAGWVWIRAWSPQYPQHHSVDGSAVPVDTHCRTIHTGIHAGG